MLAKRAQEGNRALLALILNDLTQGVMLFDMAERLIVCNDRYIDMCGRSRDIVKPGATLADVIENRKATGSLELDPEHYRREIMKSVREGGSPGRVVDAPDDRVISASNRRIEGTDYWIGTHDDITGRPRAERKSAAPIEQERRRVEVEQEIKAFR